MADQPELINVEGTENPNLGLAMELAKYVHAEFEKMEERLGNEVRKAINANAGAIRRLDNLEKRFEHLQLDLEQARHDRVDKEVKEREALYRIAQEHKSTLSTQDRINVAVDDRLSAKARARAERWRAVWDRVLPNVITGLALIVMGPIVLALFIGILVFVLQAMGVEVQFPP
jgi:hypothetical protein